MGVRRSADLSSSFKCDGETFLAGAKEKQQRFGAERAELYRKDPAVRCVPIIRFLLSNKYHLLLSVIVFDCD